MAFTASVTKPGEASPQPLQAGRFMSATPVTSGC